MISKDILSFVSRLICGVEEEKIEGFKLSNEGGDGVELLMMLSQIENYTL